jgi:hypothetical protein
VRFRLPQLRTTNFLIFKCLVANFTHVALIPTQQSFLAQARELIISSTSQDEIKRVHFLRPEEAITFIEELDRGDLDRKETVKGYKVRIKHSTVSYSDKKAPQKIIGKTIMQALTCLKGPNESWHPAQLVLATKNKR